MAKTKAKPINKQLQNSLRQLSKLGFYNPQDKRKAFSKPTKHGKGLVKKFTELGILGPKPKAEVIAVPNKQASEFEGQYKVVRGKRNHHRKTFIIAPKSNGVKIRYSKKHGTVIRETDGYVFIPIKDRMILMRGEFPKLKRNQSVVVRIGNNYKFYDSYVEVAADMMQYDPLKTSLWQYPMLGIRPKDHDEEIEI